VAQAGVECAEAQPH